MGKCYITIVLLFHVFTQIAFSEPHIDPRDCPFQCTCFEYTVDCTQTKVFPENLPEVTQEFRLSDSNIDAIPSNVFLNLNKLRTINITDSKINKVMACAFAELDSVAIRFINVDIEKVEGNSFSNIVNSSEITILHSNVQELKSFAFHNINNVYVIEIADSKIGTIHPYAFRHVQNVSDFSVVNCSVDRFLKEGFSRFYYVDFTYVLRSTIKEWQCGSVKTLFETDVNIYVSASYLTCDCSLAWLWRLHPNSSIIHEGSNRCYGSDSMLEKLNLSDICEKEEKQMTGCPQLLPTTPHTCSRQFDTPFEPEQKVEYPKYFSKPIEDNNFATKTSVTSLLPVIAIVSVFYSRLIT